MSEQLQKQRVLTGSVVSAKMDKTVVVLVQRKVKHPVYGKYVIRTTKLHVDDADNRCSEGDLVSITPSRPLSKKKSWRLLDVIDKGTSG